MKYYKNEKNIGMYGNWNRCIELSNGEYLTILNDDKASPLNWRVNKAKLNKLPANLQTKELTSNVAIVSILSSIDLIMDRYDYE